MKGDKLLKLATILGTIGASSGRGPAPRTEVTGLAADTRSLRRGELFFAIDGARADGHTFLEQARQKGALGAIVSRLDQSCPLDQYVVPDTREALALASCEFYDNPSEKFPLTGVTGTNGKTTVAFLVRAILEAQGVKCGLLGTIQNILGENQIEPSELTTAQSNRIQGWLARMFDNGCRGAVMEVSSHGLDQKRSLGCRFEVAIFMNLTPDHLDYHKDMESYFEAKSLLFKYLGNHGRAVIGWDDPYGARLVEKISGPKITFGRREKSDIRILSWAPRPEGSQVELSVFGKKIAAALPLLGSFNAQNVAAAAGAATALGISALRLEEALPALQPVPGRMEPVNAGQPFRVLVDYAHTPDALEKALLAAREHTGGRLICVAGCGGDRYRLKRGPMGRIAATLADYAVITSDNPRSEDPLLIIEAIVQGAVEAGRKEGRDFEVQPDRRQAIRRALELMRERDSLLIAGKGHEDYQILPTGKIHFDDREVAREVLRDLGFK